MQLRRSQRASDNFLSGRTAGGVLVGDQGQARIQQRAGGHVVVNSKSLRPWDDDVLKEAIPL
jgi:hypothetical protein